MIYYLTAMIMAGENRRGTAGGVPSPGRYMHVGGTLTGPHPYMARHRRAPTFSGRVLLTGHKADYDCDYDYDQNLSSEC